MGIRVLFRNSAKRAQEPQDTTVSDDQSDDRANKCRYLDLIGVSANTLVVSGGAVIVALLPGVRNGFTRRRSVRTLACYAGPEAGHRPRGWFDAAFIRL